MNEIIQTQFYDENGNDIISLCMVNSCPQERQESLEKAITKTRESPINLMHNNKLSTWEKDSSEEKIEEKMYDASLESEQTILPQKEIKQYQKIYRVKNKKHKSPRKK